MNVRDTPSNGDILPDFAEARTRTTSAFGQGRLSIQLVGEVTLAGHQSGMLAGCIRQRLVPLKRSEPLLHPLTIGSVKKELFVL
jgi:hypothetical protein